MFTRTCALPECKTEFQTDNPRKMHCTKAHSNLHQVRRWRNKHRKKGGGGGGGGGGGAPEPSLFDAITPIDADRAFTPIPVIGPRKQPERVTPEKPVYAKRSPHRRAA